MFRGLAARLGSLKRHRAARAAQLHGSRPSETRDLWRIDFSQSSAIRACYHSRKPFHPFGRARFTVSHDCPVLGSFARGQMVSAQSGFLSGFHGAKFLRSGEFWVTDQL